MTKADTLAAKAQTAAAASAPRTAAITTSPADTRLGGKAGSLPGSGGKPPFGFANLRARIRNKPRSCGVTGGKLAGSASPITEPATSPSAPTESTREGEPGWVRS